MSDYQSPWLLPEEVAELTAFKTWKRQCLALAQMGIPFRPNRVGRPLVERVAVLPEEARIKRRAQKEFSPQPEWRSNVAIRADEARAGDQAKRRDEGLKRLRRKADDQPR